MSLTTALSLCTTGPALMGLSPSNCPTGDAENDKRTHLHSNTQNIEAHTQTQARTSKQKAMCSNAYTYTLFLCRKRFVFVGKFSQGAVCMTALTCTSVYSKALAVNLCITTGTLHYAYIISEDI